MYTIQLGSFVLNGEIILYTGSGIVGVTILQYYARNLIEREALLSIYFSAWVVWLLTWKLSLVIFNPTDVIHYPASLLYYSGGIRGRWLASILTAAYIAFRLKRIKAPLVRSIQTTLIYLFGAWTGYQIILTLIDRVNWLQHTALAVLAVLLLACIWMFNSRKNAAIALMAAGFLFYALFDHYHQVWSEAPQNNGEVTVGIAQGQQAPDFELLDMKGNTVRLSQYRGKNVVLNFWASWCPPCRAEMPHMQRFHEDDQGENTVVLGVNLTSIENNANDAKAFAEQLALTFPIVLDSKGEVMNAYKIRAYPTTFFIDGHGIIRRAFFGAIDYETMKGQVSP
ncbi:peroxiredoxin family protein [Paenibacillus turpanensis]|uniref:peroxiredoxin family protein n=1 Tax=Paenibacillus turpanensis TaxID=2689078 RepID=UPI00140DB5EE|nr:TlpA disulfide reductase family protein [Paenibacillus turpanensis]